MAGFDEEILCLNIDFQIKEETLQALMYMNQ